MVVNPPLPLLTDPTAAPITLTFLPNFFNLSSPDFMYAFLDLVTQTVAAALVVPYASVGNMTIPRVLDAVFAANSTAAGTGRIVVTADVLLSSTYPTATQLIDRLSALASAGQVQFFMPLANSTYIIVGVASGARAAAPLHELTRNEWIAIAFCIFAFMVLLYFILARCQRRQGRASVSPTPSAADKAAAAGKTSSPAPKILSRKGSSAKVAPAELIGGKSGMPPVRSSPDFAISSGAGLLNNAILL